MDLDIVVSRAAGLDVHKKIVTATVITPEMTETRSYGIVTPELLELADWMAASKITHIAVEAAGVYWKPVVNLLESYDFTAVLVITPQHIMALPQRQPDVSRSQWVASLLRSGALNNHLPPRPKRELQEVVRYRTTMAHERDREANRIQKSLEELGTLDKHIIANIFGVSGKRILQAMAHGETDPKKLATLAGPELKVPREILIPALNELVEVHRHIMLSVPLQHVAFLDLQIETLDQEIAQRLQIF
ncbi:MAG: IS110 family transposase [Firmicutes bacterium]|jgi:transposase|nr:IS110 family transposase [Bacillota bacterium]MCL5013362.1 IS110 family transposase [Bacillota bacterium]